MSIGSPKRGLTSWKALTKKKKRILAIGPLLDHIKQQRNIHGPTLGEIPHLSIAFPVEEEIQSILGESANQGAKMSQVQQLELAHD